MTAKIELPANNPQIASDQYKGIYIGENYVTLGSKILLFPKEIQLSKNKYMFDAEIDIDNMMVESAADPYKQEEDADEAQQANNQEQIQEQKESEIIPQPDEHIKKSKKNDKESGDNKDEDDGSEEESSEDEDDDSEESSNQADDSEEGSSADSDAKWRTKSSGIYNKHA